MEKPQQLRTIGIIHIVSGLIQFPIAIVLTFCGSYFFACICGIITAPIGGCGACVGVAGFVCLLLIPIGILEVITGVVILVAEPPSRLLIRVTAAVEILGVLFGGLIGAIVGLVVLSMLARPEISEYLDASAVEA